MIHNFDNSTHTCEHCGKNYKHKSNLTRHQKTCFALPPDLQNVNPTAPNVNPTAPNVNPNAPNVNPNAPNVNPNAPNVNLDENQSTQCSKCKKIFTRNFSLQRHLKSGRCKEAQSLECPICHQVFTKRQARSRHVKTCVKEENVQVVNTYTNSQVATSINNTTNNNTTNNTNNVIINNHVYYNDHVIELEDGHITRRDLKRIFNGASVKAIQAIAAYANKILENENNVCVRKKYITNAYCDVRTKDGWVCRPDKSVIERFSKDVAGSANDKLYNYPDIGSEDVRRDVTSIASFEEDVVDQTNDLYREIRSVIYQKTKDDENDTMNVITEK